MSLRSPLVRFWSLRLSTYWPRLKTSLRTPESQDGRGRVKPCHLCTRRCRSLLVANYSFKTCHVLPARLRSTRARWISDISDKRCQRCQTKTRRRSIKGAVDHSKTGNSRSHRVSSQDVLAEFCLLALPRAEFRQRQRPFLTNLLARTRYR